MTELTRRRLLGSAGVGAAGIGLGGVGGYLVGSETAKADDGTGSVPFYGEHQAGIDTPAQDRLHFAAFDLVDDEPRRAARADAGMVARRRRNDRRPDDRRRQLAIELAPPEDTGETVGLLPSRLTVTFGFGPEPLRASAGSASPASGRRRCARSRRCRPTS